MASIGEIEAGAISAQGKAESSEVSVDIYAYVFVDGMANLDAQKKRRDFLKNGIKIAKSGNPVTGQTISKWVNPSCPKDNGSSIEDELHINVPFFLDFEYGLLKQNILQNKSNNLKQEIENFVDQYLIDDNVRSIKIHFLILVYNHLDVLTHLLYPFGALAVTNEAQRRKFVENIFCDKRFLNNDKITYKDVEILTSVNPFGISNQGEEATFVSNSNDYKRIIKDDDVPYGIDVDTPQDIDVQDAAVLCQCTYNSQSPFESSVPDLIIDGVKKAVSSIGEGSSMGFKSIFTKDNLDIILQDSLINFDTPENRKLSLALIISAFNGVFNDLSTLGVINIGTPPSAPSMELNKLILNIPDLIVKCKNLTANIVDNFKKEFSQHIQQELERQEESKKKQDERLANGIIIYHAKDGYGLVTDPAMTKRDDCTFTVYDEVSQDELTNLLGALSSSLIDCTSGFYSKLYKGRTNGKYFYCTSGTNMLSWNDWYNNISQGLLGLSKQYTQSVRIAKKLDENIGENRLFFIGHSLGGGLASNNALVTTRRHAITFNAAGLNFLRVKATLLLNNRRDLFHPNRRRSKIHAYIIDGEILNRALSKIGEGAYGTKYVIKKDTSEDLWELGSLGRHSIADTFLNLKRIDQLSIYNTLSIPRQ